MLVASEPVQGVLSHQEPLLLSQVTSPITGTWPCLWLWIISVIWGDYVSPVPSWEAVKAQNARDTSSPLQPPVPATGQQTYSVPDTPKASLTSSWKDSDWWEEQTRINKASREGLFRRSRGPGGECNTITGDPVKPRGGDAFLGGRTDWFTEWPAQGHTASWPRGWIQSEPRRLQGPGLPHRAARQHSSVR